MGGPGSREGVAIAAALSSLNIAKARELLTWWSETGSDETERRRHGDELWAWTHRAIGYGSVLTPIAPRHEVLLSAIDHYQAALQVYNEADCVS